MTLNKWNTSLGDLNPRLSSMEYDRISREIYVAHPGISVAEATAIFESMLARLGKRGTTTTFRKYFEAKLATRRTPVPSGCGNTKIGGRPAWPVWGMFAVAVLVLVGIWHPYVALFLLFFALFACTETGSADVSHRSHGRHRWLTNGLRPRRMHWGPRRLF